MDCGRRPSVIAIVLIGMLPLIAAGGCGSSRPGADGGAAEVSSGDSRSDGVTAGACDPGLQDCPSGNKCDFFCSGAVPVIGCRADNGGGGDLGVTCGGDRVCKKGSGCFAAAGSNAVCRKYCTGDGDCPTGQCQAAMISIPCSPGVSMPLTMKICF